MVHSSLQLLPLWIFSFLLWFRSFCGWRHGRGSFWVLVEESPSVIGSLFLFARLGGRSREDRIGGLVWFIYNYFVASYVQRNQGQWK
ncbi:hypothetical protein V8C26DRAFT_383883 [Trichoderma gracile]